MAEEPIRERIVQQCEASLQAIDGTGPYHYALASVQRGKAVPGDLANLPAAFLDEGDEAISQDTQLLLTRVLPIIIEVWVRSADEAWVRLAEGGLPTLANRMVADVERALMADPTRGGLAQRTTLTRNSRVQDESPGLLAAIRVEGEIQYWTAERDPASSG